MKTSTNNVIALEDTADTADVPRTSAKTTQYTPLAQYMNDHKVPGSAANDPHHLALEDFLFEHMRERANAQPE